jgi:fructokinase
VSEAPLIGAIEAGGTKMVCAIGRTWREVRDAPAHVVPTTTPEETMARVLDWFAARHAVTPLRAIGVASFGPIDFDADAIAATTPKEQWRGFRWRRAIAARFGDLPLGYDTDTNAAGVAEWRWGAAQGCGVSVYVTVGTGIGGGLVIDGMPVHGLLHPEFGHMFVPRQAGDDFAGTCPSHGDCLEGLASGEAVARRWHRPGPELGPEHPAWELESSYLALAVVNIAMIASPQIVVLGGGVTAVEGLLERVRDKVRTAVNGYLPREELGADVGHYLVAPGLGPSSGVVGAFALGQRAADASRAPSA